MFLTGGGAGEGQPRLLLPGLWTGSLPADQGRRHGGGAQRVHAAATTAGHHMRPRDAAQALRGPGQAHRHHLQSFFPPELPHIQHLLLDHLQSAAARGHPRKLVKGSQHFSFFVFYFFFFSSHSSSSSLRTKTACRIYIKEEELCQEAYVYMLHCSKLCAQVRLQDLGFVDLGLVWFVFAFVFSLALGSFGSVGKKKKKKEIIKKIYIYRCYL